MHEHAASSGAQAGPAQRPRFKVVASVVMAMRRFQASLNPTYSYGKRQSDSGAETVTASNHVIVQPAGAPRDASGRTTSGRTLSGRTISGRPTSAAQQHGHKGNLLFRPLPEVENVASG